MNWDEQSDRAAIRYYSDWCPDGIQEAHRRGARWQRQALLSDETVERAARAFYENAYTAIHESIRPSWSRLVEVEPDTADRYRDHMRAALTAALEGEQ